MERRLVRALKIGCVLFCVLSASLAGFGSGKMQAQDDQAPEAAGLAGGEMVRGTVLSTTSDHLAIKTDKGVGYQVNVTSNTRMMKDRQPIRIAEIRPGDTVGAMGVLDAPARTVHALFVMVVDAGQVKQMREGLGKVYIAGKVTAIEDLKLTIQRPDGISQIIAVDEGTSFRRGGRQMQAMVDGSGAIPRGAPPSNDSGGESITLLDIKKGDTIAGKGELKSGIFVPSQLAVMDPATRQRRHPAGGSTDAAPTTPIAEPK